MTKVGKKSGLGINFIFNLLSQLVTVLVPIIATPHLSRILREEGNGQYSYSYSIITYFVLFANIGFNIYGQREIAKYKDDKEKRSKIFFEILIIKFIMTIISCGVLFAILFSIGFGENYNQIIMILSIMVISSAFDIQFFFQGIENFRSIAIRTILMRLAGLIGIYIFVREYGDVDKYAMCMAFSMVGANLTMWPSLIRRVKFVNPKTFEFKHHIKPSILIFLPTLAVTIYSVFDKTMIGLFAKNPDYENGCYDQAYKINAAALMAITVISPVLIPRNTYDYYNGNHDALKEHVYFACSYVWMIGLPMIAGFLVISNSISSWFLGVGYLEVPQLLRIMSVRFIASGFGVVFGEQLFIAIGKEKYPTVATGIAAVLNVALNSVLIPFMGSVGAAITTAVSECVVTFVLGLFVIRNKIVSLKKIIILGIKPAIAATIMFVPIYFMDQNMDYTLVNTIIIVGVGVVAYFVALFALRDKFLIDICKWILSKVFKKKNQPTLENANNLDTTVVEENSNSLQAEENNE